MDTSSINTGDRVAYDESVHTVGEAYNGANVLLTDDEERRRVNPDSIGTVEEMNTEAIDGIGPARSEDLEGAGVTTIGELANADLDELASTDLSRDRALDSINAARDLLDLEPIEDDGTEDEETTEPIEAPGEDTDSQSEAVDEFVEE